MTSKTTYEITDEQIAEIEAIAENGCGIPEYLADDVVAIISRLRSAERDAARYRWLRDSGNFSPSAFGGWALNCGYTRARPRQLDEAVDSGMLEARKQ